MTVHNQIVQKLGLNCYTVPIGNIQGDCPKERQQIQFPPSILEAWKHPHGGVHRLEGDLGGQVQGLAVHRSLEVLPQEFPVPGPVSMQIQIVINEEDFLVFGNQ